MSFLNTLFHWQFCFNAGKHQVEAKLKNQGKNKYFFDGTVKNIQ